MRTPELCTEIDFPGNHRIRIFDHSQVYFGDYCHVRLEVTCAIPLSPNAELSAGAGDESPEFAVYSRYLERMAVPSADVDTVKQTLIDEFRRTSLPYLASADFPRRFIARSLSGHAPVKKRYTQSAG